MERSFIYFVGLILLTGWVNGQDFRFRRMLMERELALRRAYPFGMPRILRPRGMFPPPFAFQRALLQRRALGLGGLGGPGVFGGFNPFVASPLSGLGAPGFGNPFLESGPTGFPPGFGLGQGIGGLGQGIGGLGQGIGGLTRDFNGDLIDMSAFGGGISPFNAPGLTSGLGGGASGVGGGIALGGGTSASSIGTTSTGQPNTIADVSGMSGRPSTTGGAGQPTSGGGATQPGGTSNPNFAVPATGRIDPQVPVGGIRFQAGPMANTGFGSVGFSSNIPSGFGGAGMSPGFVGQSPPLPGQPISSSFPGQPVGPMAEQPRPAVAGQFSPPQQPQFQPAGAGSNVLTSGANSGVQFQSGSAQPPAGVSTLFPSSPMTPFAPQPGIFSGVSPFGLDPRFGAQPVPNGQFQGFPSAGGAQRFVPSDPRFGQALPGTQPVGGATFGAGTQPVGGATFGAGTQPIGGATFGAGTQPVGGATFGAGTQQLGGATFGAGTQQLGGGTTFGAGSQQLGGGTTFGAGTQPLGGAGTFMAGSTQQFGGGTTFGSGTQIGSQVGQSGSAFTTGTQPGMTNPNVFPSAQGPLVSSQFTSILPAQQIFNPAANVQPTQPSQTALKAQQLAGQGGSAQGTSSTMIVNTGSPQPPQPTSIGQPSSNFVSTNTVINTGTVPVAGNVPVATGTAGDQNQFRVVEVGNILDSSNFIATDRTVDGSTGATSGGFRPLGDVNTGSQTGTQTVSNTDSTGSRTVMTVTTTKTENLQLPPSPMNQDFSFFAPPNNNELVAPGGTFNAPGGTFNAPNLPTEKTASLTINTSGGGSSPQGGNTASNMGVSQPGFSTTTVERRMTVEGPAEPSMMTDLVPGSPAIGTILVPGSPADAANQGQPIDVIGPNPSTGAGTLGQPIDVIGPNPAISPGSP